MLFATVRQRKIYVKAPQTVVKDGVNVDVLRLEMDDEWAEMTSIICVFSNGSVKKEVMHTFGQPITVPWECLESTGVLMLGITGYVGTQKVMTTMNADNGWEIVQNSETTGEEQFEETPTLTQQLLEAATSANNAAAAANTAKQDILDAVSNGEFDGAPGKDGVDGLPGADGYSPSAKVTQTASGAEITIIDKGGTTTATVTNGKDGAAGKDGADGKSAYQYAQDGGYTGTEEEFAGKMAAEIPFIDNTLTKSGQAADAKAVGDALRSLSDEIDTTSESKVSAHNTGTDTHNDIRVLIQGLTDRLNALADSDDTTLDQLSEVVAYIKSNRELIASITTDKVSVADIIDNLTTNVANKPLSAAQGVALKALIDAISIPEKLPNPNALTFTGAATGSYDGSAPLEVEIPSGGGGTSGDYIPVPTSAEVGQTIVVKAVDENGKPTEWEPVALPERVQADWNQNDSSAADYVKNRTHYAESVYADYVLNMNNTAIVGFSLPEVGETTTVKINGVESVETVKEAESSYIGISYKYIGNIDFDSLLTGGTGWCAVDINGQVFGVANPDTTITVEAIVVHKINDKFINFDGFVRTFDYYFTDYTLYKSLYDDDGNVCNLYMCNNFIVPEMNSQLFGFMNKVGFSNVGSIGTNSCYIIGYIIHSEDGSITIQEVVLGTNTSEMEKLAANYGFTHTTNPNA